MKLGLVTYDIAKDWDIDTMIGNLEETEFDGVELRTTHAHGVEVALGPEKREEVAGTFYNSRIELVALGSVCEYHSDDPDQVEKNIEETKEFIQLAADVGARGVKVRPNGLQEDKGIPIQETLEQIGHSLRICGEFAEDYGMELYLEVHGRGTSHPPYIRTILETANHSRVKACWNCNRTDLDETGSIETYFEMLKPWIAHVHLHDLFDKDYPYNALFNLLNSMNYDGYTMSEMPASDDPLRLMHYYKGVWEKLQQSS
ncbi:sugar phosphate isomerase/epimerase family protein [Planctomycetota bacterium]